MIFLVLAFLAGIHYGHADMDNYVTREQYDKLARRFAYSAIAATKNVMGESWYGAK